MDLIPSAAIGALALLCGIAWYRYRHPSRYDLRLLNEEAPSEDEAYDEELIGDSGPYCSACDEPNPAGTVFCRSCGRKLG